MDQIFLEPSRDFQKTGKTFLVSAKALLRCKAISLYPWVCCGSLGNVINSPCVLPTSFHPRKRCQGHVSLHFCSPALCPERLRGIQALTQTLHMRHEPEWQTPQMLTRLFCCLRKRKGDARDGAQLEASMLT